MELQEILKELDNTEKMQYIDSTANEYFRYLYYSKKFSFILNKLDSKEILTKEEWKYLIEKLYMVTYKAVLEEDKLNVFDKINYVINRIVTKIFKSGKIYNECAKMLAFIESIKLEKEINEDLSYGFERVEKEKNIEDLSILLRQHREAMIFRDNQDAFIDSYNDGKTGVMTDMDLLYMDCMDKSFIREKELVKEYK